MARAARAALADSRALEEEYLRDQMHGGARFVGAGATPSMGLSQFRGGARHYEESSSDEERKKVQKHRKKHHKRHGGAGVAGLLGDIGDVVGTAVNTAARRSGTAARTAAAEAATAAAAARAATAGTGAAGATALVPRTGAYGFLPSTDPLASFISATRGTPQLLLTDAASAANAAAAPTTVAARLAALGVTPARAAAALAAGVTVAGLADYFSQQQQQQQPPDAGLYDQYNNPNWPGTVVVPPRNPTVIVDGPGSGPYLGNPSGPSTRPGNVPGGMTPAEIAFYLQSGNLPRGFYKESKNLRTGAGKSDGRSARAAVVNKVMREHGLSLPAASKFVKVHGLY